MIIDGNVASIQLTTDYSVTKWGFRIRAYEKKACVCPEVLQPVCGEDGATYDNACQAGEDEQITCAGGGTTTVSLADNQAIAVVVEPMAPPNDDRDGDGVDELAAGAPGGKP